MMDNKLCLTKQFEMYNWKYKNNQNLQQQRVKFTKKDYHSEFSEPLDFAREGTDHCIPTMYTTAVS